MENQTILDLLQELHKKLDCNRNFSEYTANEGNQTAKQAISLIQKWQVEKNDFEMIQIIDKVISELNSAIKSAQVFY